MKRIGMIVALLALLGAAVAAADEAPTRTEYVQQLEAICKPDALATQTAMRGARGDIQAERLTVATTKFAKAMRIFGGTVKKISAVPRPPADEAKLAQVVHPPEPAGVLPAADHRTAACRADDQGPAAHRPLHPQRQPRQQRGPRLRLQLLQLQVLEVRMRGRRGTAAGRAFGALLLSLLLVALAASDRRWRANPERAPDRLTGRRPRAARPTPRSARPGRGPSRRWPADHRRHLDPPRHPGRTEPAGTGCPRHARAAAVSGAEAPQHHLDRGARRLRRCARRPRPALGAGPRPEPAGVRGPRRAARLQRDGEGTAGGDLPRLRRQPADRRRPALPAAPGNGTGPHPAGRRPAAGASAPGRTSRTSKSSSSAASPTAAASAATSAPPARSRSGSPPASSPSRKPTSPSPAGAGWAPASPAPAAPANSVSTRFRRLMVC